MIYSSDNNDIIISLDYSISHYDLYTKHLDYSISHYDLYSMTYMSYFSISFDLWLTILNILESSELNINTPSSP